MPRALPDETRKHGPMSLRHQAPKPRIVQHQNRRYSVRLEPVFWLALERMAARDNVRLGQLIGNLAGGYSGRNFSSFLRVFCMLEAERELAGIELGAANPGLVEVVLASPSPGLLLSERRTIIEANKAFLDWLGPTEQEIKGAEVTSIIQVRTNPTLNEAWKLLLSGERNRLDAKILHVTPGRVNAAQGVMISLLGDTTAKSYTVMWLVTTATRTAGKFTVTQPLGG